MKAARRGGIVATITAIQVGDNGAADSATAANGVIMAVGVSKAAKRKGHGLKGVTGTEAKAVVIGTEAVAAIMIMMAMAAAVAGDSAIITATGIAGGGRIGAMIGNITATPIATFIASRAIMIPTAIIPTIAASRSVSSLTIFSLASAIGLMIRIATGCRRYTAHIAGSVTMMMWCSSICATAVLSM
jgi:hypothetical protein